MEYAIFGLLVLGWVFLLGVVYGFRLASRWTNGLDSRKRREPLEETKSEGRQRQTTLIYIWDSHSRTLAGPYNSEELLGG
jgi:hypothetical protein